jgi:hypothetical protein
MTPDDTPRVGEGPRRDGVRRLAEIAGRTEGLEVVIARPGTAAVAA